MATISGRRSEMFLAQEFMKQHPDIGVIYEASPANWQEISGKIFAEFASGDAPDVLEGVAGLAERGLLLDLDPLIARDSKEIDFSDFYEPSVEPSPLDDRRYGLPVYGMLIVVLFYNKDLFDSAGIPYPDASWTWQTFVDAAKRLTLDTDGDGYTDVYGCNVFLTSVSGQGPIMWSYGCDYLNREMNKVTVNCPECVEAFQMLYDLRWKHNVLPRVSEGREGAPTLMLFSAGRFAMEVTHAALIRDLRAAGHKIRWDVAPVPKGPRGRATRFGSYPLSIASTTKHPEEAWELLKFLASPFAMRTRLRMGSAAFTPARRSVAESPDYLGVTPPDHPEVFVDAIGYARMDRCQECVIGPEISQAIQTQLDLLWLNKPSVDEALRRAEAEAAPIMKRYLHETQETGRKP